MKTKQAEHPPEGATNMTVATVEIPENVIVENPRIAAMGEREARAGLAECLRASAVKLAEAAQYVKRLDDLGADLSDIAGPTLNTLRRIAHGQVLPEVVSNYAERPSLRDRIGSLPIPEQKRLSDPEATVEVAVEKQDGTLDAVALPVRALTQRQVHQVFGCGKLRDVAEQNAVIRERQASAAKSLSATPYDVKPREGIVVFHGPCRVSRDELDLIRRRLGR